MSLIQPTSREQIDMQTFRPNERGYIGVPFHEDVVVISVPHCGTVFTRELLHCRYIHCDELQSILEFIEGKVIVIPLRDPRAVWNSWIQREGTGFAINRERFDVNWKRLEQIDKMFDPYYIPVDHADRQMHLAALEQRLGRRLFTTWRKENSIKTGNLVIEKDLARIYARDPVRRFYGIRQNESNASNAA